LLPAAPAGPFLCRGHCDFRFCQLDATADAAKQYDRIGIFESDDRGADRLLCQVQGFGGTRHVLAFGDSDESAQLLEGHTAFMTARMSPTLGSLSRSRGKPPAAEAHCS